MTALAKEPADSSVVGPQLPSFREFDLVLSLRTSGLHPGNCFPRDSSRSTAAVAHKGRPLVVQEDLQGPLDAQSLLLPDRAARAAGQ